MWNIFWAVVGGGGCGCGCAVISMVVMGDCGCGFGGVVVVAIVYCIGNIILLCYLYYFNVLNDEIKLLMLGVL